MEKLKFFKGLFFGLIMSAAMWGGVIWTVTKIDKNEFQPEVTEIDIKEPVAANFSLAVYRNVLVFIP